MKKKATIRDIAATLNISTATVSRALNNAPGVSAGLREQIEATAASMGYIENNTSSNIIGLVLGDVRNPFYADLTFGIQKALEQYRYTILIFNSEYNVVKEKSFISMAARLQLAGLILITAQNSMTEDLLMSLDIPIVFVNRSLGMTNYDSVQMDNFKAGYIAAMHLIELGHTNIGFLRGQASSPASQNRYEGFLQAMKNCSLPVLEERVWAGDLKMSAGYATAAKLFSLPDSERPTALITTNDYMALGVVDWCNEHSVSIPKDLSIISFDNIEFSKIHGIELTTISQQVDVMGKTAVELMMQRIKNTSQNPQRIILEPKLIVRKSTGKP